MSGIPKNPLWYFGCAVLVMAACLLWACTMFFVLKLGAAATNQTGPASPQPAEMPKGNDMPRLTTRELRVLTEKRELDAKVEKLKACIDDKKKAPFLGMEVLPEQLEAMRAYSKALGQRIEAMGIEDEVVEVATEEGAQSE